MEFLLQIRRNGLLEPKTNTAKRNRLAAQNLRNSGGRIRTSDLRVMSPTSYQAALPRDLIFNTIASFILYATKKDKIMINLELCVFFSRVIGGWDAKLLPF
jgi:hypothetical protein